MNTSVTATNRLVTLGTMAFTALCACTKDLDQDPLSEIGSGNFYQTPDQIEQGVNGIYAQLSAYPERQFYLSDIRSDNIYGVGEAGVRDHEPVNNFANTIAVNPYMEEAWNGYFNGIMTANTMIDMLSDEAVLEVIEDVDLRDRHLAEARFLRALFYFDLLRYFGPVPLLPAALTPEETLEIGRSPVPEVYELVIDDLQYASGNLPDSYEGGDLGRATSWAAKGLLARVYLTRSGPSYGIDGPGLESGEYEQALELLNEIIDEGPFSLLDNFSDIFAYTNEQNAEIVFDVQYISGGLGLGALYPGEMVPSAYFEAVGVPFPGGLEVKPVSNDLLASFGEDDLRREQTVHPGFEDVNGNFQPQPFYRKFLDESRHGLDRFDWEINFPVIRFTDVLMMKAEAILHGAPGSQAEVDDIVSQVRMRAGLSPASQVDLDMLMEERRREFAAEGLRWHDLVRSGFVLEVINAWIPEEDIRNQMRSEIDANMTVYPVPQNQIDVKAGLYEQNPGYQ